MWKINRVAAPLLLACACVNNALALESLALGEVSSLPASIRMVTDCGTWQHEGQGGTRRLVLADVYGGASTEVYVQWLSAGAKNDTPKVLQTTPIAELNNDHAQYSFSAARCVKTSKGWAVKLRGTFEHDESGKTRELSIQLIDIGKYVLTQPARR
jgi:hypothetical protein